MSKKSTAPRRVIVITLPEDAPVNCPGIVGHALFAAGVKTKVTEFTEHASISDIIAEIEQAR